MIGFINIFFFIMVEKIGTKIKKNTHFIWANFAAEKIVH